MSSLSQPRYLVYLLAMLWLTPGAFAQKNLLATVCPECGIELQNMAQAHFCKPRPENDCAAAKAYLRRHATEFSSKDIQAMECWEALLFAGNRGFKTAEERREEAQRNAEEAQRKAEQEARFARAEADRESSDAIWDLRRSDEDQGRSLVDQARGNVSALDNIIGQLNVKIAQAKAVQEQSELAGNLQTADEIGRLIRMYKSLSDDAESAKLSGGSQFGIYGSAQEQVDSAEEYSGYVESVIDWGLELAAAGESPDVTASVLDAGEAVAEGLGMFDGPADVYGGVDPLEIGMDNMDALYGDRGSGSPIDVMATPIKTAGAGIEKVFDTAFGHINASEADAAAYEGSAANGQTIGDWLRSGNTASEFGLADAPADATLGRDQAPTHMQSPQGDGHLRAIGRQVKDLLEPEMGDVSSAAGTHRQLRNLLDPTTAYHQQAATPLKDLLKPK